MFGCPAQLPCDYYFALGKIIKVFLIKNKDNPQHWVSQKPFLVAEIAPTTVKAREEHHLNSIENACDSQRLKIGDCLDDHYLQVESSLKILALLESMKQEGRQKNTLTLNCIQTPRPPP